MTTLFLAWQDPKESRAWYPIGRLDADASKGLFRFRYVRGAQRAQREAGMTPLISFPDIKKRYESTELFPLFKNRILSPDREEFEDYLRELDLTPDKADPLEILALSEGRRQTDTLEVFPKINVSENGAFRCRFFLHGWRHVCEPSQERINTLMPGEELRVALEMNNPATGLAVQVQTGDYQMVGWTPRYLVLDLARAIGESFKNIRAAVVKVNPSPAPSQQRVLIEMTGSWPKRYEPMSDEDLADISA
ncbi:MAG: DNA-binding protein [Candidatus Hydrogenedentes bacterium]|nr:DNA-binding protein [Candidatus Hydrogenedentota bacterium]